ncbi:hypothetical protein ABID16_003093 [Rhizobium aquaticum]|uniref:Asparagine synthetase domain-containing protein n=1 Tax=Rhizobium aquaticum TaxID=1549636 RepID=A0ABV2J367_9HYPH
MKDPSLQKRRTCRDRFRAQMMTASKMRQANPAASVSSQLGILLLAAFGRLPIMMPAPTCRPTYVSPPLSHGMAENISVAERLGVAVRYVPIVLKFGHVPKWRLIDDIKFGGPLRHDAIQELRRNAPFQSLPWLDHVAKNGRWNDLLLALSSANTSEEIDAELLKSTLIWMRHLKHDDELKGSAATDDSTMKV